MELLKPDNAQKGTGIEQATSKGVLLLLVAAAEGRVVVTILDRPAGEACAPTEC